MYTRRLTRFKMEVFRKVNTGRWLILASCLILIGVIVYQQHSHVTTQRTSYNLWQSVRLDPGDLLDRRTYTTNRHGPPLDLYYETGGGYLYSKYAFPFRAPSGIQDCSAMIQFSQHRNHVEMSKSETATFLKQREYELDTGLYELICEQFKREKGYVTHHLSEMERDFPIAYSMLVYKDFVQVEMLLRAIYRPQNLYCIHVDLKAEVGFRANVERLAGCFENVFLASRSVNVMWGDFSVLEPEVVCLQDLWNMSVNTSGNTSGNTSVPWKYWINLTGQEFPLRTNYELVKILRALNGSNNIEGLSGSDIVFRLLRTGFPPHDLYPVKGAIHVVISREFADFVLHSNVSRDLLNWSRNVDHPDETFFNILNYNPSLKAPGSYRGTHKTSAVENPFIARFKNWFDEWYCYGMQMRGICVFGTGDLPLLATREELFANKFVLDYAPEALYCMEELIYNRTLEEYLGILDFNVSYYETRDFVKNRY